MGTKLVVSVDGLLLTNQNTIVSSRSLDEVILVGTSSQFNNLTSDQRTQILSRKASNIGGATLSVALANESSASLSDDFYNFLSSNNLSFFNDPGLQSLSSSIVLTSNGSETFTSISSSNFADFNSSSLTSNSLYTAGSSLSLGSNFGTKPTITVSSPTFLDDLSGSIAVNITAAQFASILAANTDGSKISVADIANIAVNGDTSDPTPFVGTLGRLVASDVTTNYDGSNRLGNTTARGATSTDPGNQSGGVYFNDPNPITISILQALRLPLMGAFPHENKVTLEDTAENLAVGLKAFTDGQIASFNEVLISDNATLVLDPTTFKRLDTANIDASWSIHDGTTVLKKSGGNASIQIKGTYADFVSSGLWSGSALATTLTTATDAANLVSQVSSYELSGTISSATELANHKAVAQAFSDSGATVTTNLNFSSSFTSSAVTADAFTNLAILDALTSENLISDNFTSGVTITDSSDNIRALITNTTASVVAAKANISGLTSTTDTTEKIILTWDEYVGALDGGSFASSSTSKYPVSVIAFQNLQNVELIVTGTAAEIKNIVDSYSTALTSFPSGLTFKILDGNSLTLTQSQLDQLDARIEGVVVVSDTSSGIATLLNNAIPESVQQITPVDSSGNSTDLAITFDQFRNLPNYFSGDVVITDSEDNIVAALNEDLLDDRVTTLVIKTGTDSTSLGKATTTGGSTSTADSALTVTAAAAKNILSKKVYSQVNYDAGNTTSYMDISIVDRGSAIANFIETASFPGTSSAADVTGSIDFVEKDGGSITLTYNQNLAYQAIPSGILKSSLTTTPALASINLSTIASSITALSTSLSTAQSTIVANTDAEVAAQTTSLEGTISTARSTIVKNTDDETSALSTSISTAQSTIVKNTDDEAAAHQSTLSTEIAALSTARATEKVTVSEAGASPSANTDIVDTHTNILTLLGSAVHANIRSIDVLSGDTLKLTSAQFQKLLDAETTAGTVLFAGKIKLATTLSGTYAEVYAQITDYRIALEEGFAASEYSSTVSGTVTVAEAETLRVAGLTMSNQTYSIKDTLALTKAQADSDTGGVLANAAGVEFMTSAGAAVVITDEGTNHADLQTIANIATGPITATVEGTGASLADGGLSNLDKNDKVTFRITTSATPANVHTLSDETGDSYLIDFSTNNAVLTGAYTDFITAGAATNTTDFDEVIAHTQSVPITLSGVTLNDSSVQNPDLNRLFNQAEGAVTVSITDNTESVLSDTLTISSDDKVSINFGTKTATTSIIDAINALAQQSGLLSITGTLNGVTSTMVGNLHADLDSGNSTINFNMATDSTGTLDVAAAAGLLDHTASTATVNFGGGISDSLSAFATTSATTNNLQTLYAKDTDLAITIDNSGTALSTADDITALNKIATLFQASGTGTMTATVSSEKSILVSGAVGSEAATLGTDTTDTINITVSDALTPNEWATIKAKTGGTVTASGGFSAALSQYASTTALETNWDNAVTANPNTAVAITDTKLTTSDHITALNLIANDATHTGANAKITATVEAALATLGVGTLKTSSSDPVAYTVTDTDLVNADISDLNTLKGKTAGVVTIGGVTATASQLSSLNTGTTDDVTLTASGSTNTVAEALVLARKTNALTNISIVGITDTQAQISGTGVANTATGLSELKTLVGSSPTTAQAIDSLYNRVTGSVTISGGAIDVDNAVNISSFTVGSGGSAISYTISDSAGDDTSGNEGLATTTSDVNRAIANASTVTQTGTALTIAQAQEMLEAENGDALTSAAKFTYAVSDTYTAITNASSGASGVHAKLAHDRAAATNGVTLTPASVSDLIAHVTALSSGSVYTVRDSLDNLAASTTNLPALLSKAASIVITDTAIDGDDSDTRDKLRTVVSRAVDGTDAVPITATIQGKYDTMIGTLAVDSSNAANVINTSATRQDDITLKIETESHTVAELVALQALTNQSTMTFVGGVGIADSITNLIKNDNTSASDNLAAVITATSNPPVSLTAFTLSDDNEIIALNSLAGLTGIGAITGTITDTNGTYLLADNSAGGATQIGLSSDDTVSIALGTGLTLDATTTTELGHLIQAAGITSINGTITTNAARAATIGAVTDSNSSLKANFILSEQANVSQASAIVGNTSGTVTFHADGISDSLSAYLNGSNLSDGWTAIKNEDNTVKITVTGFSSPATSTEITNFNTVAAATSGVVTATISSDASTLAGLSTTSFSSGNDALSITVSDYISPSAFVTLDARTANSITLTSGVEANFADLIGAVSAAAGVTAAVADDADITIKITDTVSDNYSRVNTLANLTGFTGDIEATISGTASNLSGADLNNLSNGAGHADNISFQVTGDATTAELKTLSDRTTATNMTVGGNITGTISTFITDGTTSETTNYAAAKSHTTDEPISLSEVTVSSGAIIDQVNALFSGADTNTVITGTLTDSGGTILTAAGGKEISTGSNDVITVHIGTNIDPDAGKLAQLKKLVDQAGVTRINGSMTISAADIATLKTDFNNSTKIAKNYIAFTLDDAVTAQEASDLVDLTNGTITFGAAGINDTIGNLANETGTAISSELSNALGSNGDSTVDITVTNGGTALSTSAHVKALNVIHAAQNSANDITATLAIDKTEAALFSGISNKDLTITVSDAMSVSEFGTLDAVSKNNITLTTGLSDSLGNLAPSGSVDSRVTAAIAQDALSTLNVIVTPAVTENHTHLNTLAAAVPGTTTASVTGTATELAALTSLGTSDPVTYTIASNASALQLKNIAGNTALLTGNSNAAATFSGSYKVSDVMSNIMQNTTTLSANLTTGLTIFSSVPSISLSSAFTLANDDSIVTLNNLMALATVGGLSGTINDDNGAYLLNGTGTQLATGAATHDALAIDFGTVTADADSTNLNEIEDLAQMKGTHSITGTVNSVSAAQASAIGSMNDLNDATGDSNNTSTITFNVDEAISPSVAASLAGKGTAAYGAGLTGAVNLFATGALSSEFQSEYSTAITEDPDVAINITGTLTSAGNIRALNKAASGTTGNVTATIETTSDVTDLLSISHASRSATIGITITDNATLAQYNTAKDATDSAVQVTGALRDSLANLTDSSNALETAAQNLVSGDTNVNIELTDDPVSSSDALEQLNAVAGATGHLGTITATVEASASDINTKLGNLGTGDPITFTVTGTSDWTALQSVDTKTSLSTIDVAAITDTYDNIILMTADADFDHADATLTIKSDQTTSKAEYDALDLLTTGTVAFSRISDNYSNLKAMGDSGLLNGKVVTATGQLTVEQLDQLQTYSATSIAYNITDNTTNILNATNSDLRGVSTAVTVDNTGTSETLSIANIASINTKLGGSDPSYSTINDTAATLGTDNTHAARMASKTIVITDNATAAQYRQALTNAGGATVSGAIVETSSAALAAGATLSNATSVVLQVQSNDKDFTSTSFQSEVTGFDLNGQTGVLFNIADVDGKTITDSAGGGNYIISDTYDAIKDADEDDGAGSPAATDAAKFAKLYGATEIQVTDYDATANAGAGDDLSIIGNTTANQSVVTNTAGIDSIATTDIKITLSSDTTITDAIGEKLTTVTKVDLSGTDTDLTIESDVLDGSTNEWSSLSTITGLGSTNSLIITDVADNANGFIDLYGISTLTSIDGVTITGSTGVDIVNLSPALTESGTTTIDLGSDTAADRIYFGISKNSLSSTDTDNVLYTAVSNFSASNDRIGLYYYDYTDSPITAVNQTKRTGVSGGTTTLSSDRTFIEEDSTTRFSALSGFDKVSEIQSAIAEGVGAFTSGANRLMFAHYTFDESASTNYAIINAADLTGISTSSDLLESEDFKVIGIATIAGVAEGALGTLGGYNLTQTKNSGLSGT